MPENDVNLQVGVDDSAIQGLIGRLGDVQTSFGVLPSNISQSMSQVESNIQQSGDKIGTIFNEVGQHAKEHLGEGVHEAGEKASEGIEKFHGTIEGATGGVQGFTSGLGDMLGKLGPEGAAIGAVVAALGGLAAVGFEVAEREEKITMGFLNQGKSMEEAEKATKALEEQTRKISDTQNVNKIELEKAAGQYQAMGGVLDDHGEKLKQLAALSTRTHGDMSAAADALAKAEQGNIMPLQKLYPEMKGNADQAEVMKHVHESLNATMKSQEELAGGSVGSYNRMKNSFEEITEKAGAFVLEGLQPIFDIITNYIVPVISTLVDGFMGVIEVIKFVDEVIVGAIEYLGEITGVTGVLSEAWTGLKETIQAVIEWFTKTIDTIKNVGSAVTDFLGITNKSTEAEKESEEQTKKTEEAKKSYEAQLKKNESALDDLSKAQENETKTAKDSQDKAIVAIIALDKQMKTATGSELEELQKRKDAWVAYGKTASTTQEQLADEQHKAALAIGAAVDNDEKKAKDTSKKVAKDALVKKKEELDKALEAERITISNALLANEITESQAKSKALEAQKIYDESLLKFEQDHRKQYGTLIAAAENKVHQDVANIRKETFDEQTKALTENFDKEKIVIQEDVINKKITKEEAKKRELQAESVFHGDMINLLKSFGKETDKEFLAQAKADEQIALDADTEREKKLKQSYDLKLQGEQIHLQEMKKARNQDDAQKVAETELEGQIELEKENEKYRLELKAAVGNAAAIEAVNKQHNANLISITQKNADEVGKIHETTAKKFAGPIASAFTAGFHTMMKGADDWASKLTQSNNVAESIFGNLLSGFTKMIEGLVEQFIEFEVAYQVLNVITGGGAEAIMGSFSLAKGLGLANGGVVGLSEGGVANSPQLLGFAGGGNPMVYGEAGPEVAVPLNKYPGMMDLMQGNSNAGVISALKDVHSAILNQKIATPIDGYRNLLSTRASQQQANQRKL